MQVRGREAAHVLGRLSQLVDHQRAQHGGLEQRSEGRGHAAQHQQTLVVVVVEPSGVQLFREVCGQTTAHVALHAQ
jgi:hypothetical protein